MNQVVCVIFIPPLFTISPQKIKNKHLLIMFYIYFVWKISFSLRLLGRLWTNERWVFSTIVIFIKNTRIFILMSRFYRNKKYYVERRCLCKIFILFIFLVNLVNTEFQHFQELLWGLKSSRNHRFHDPGSTIASLPPLDVFKLFDILNFDDSVKNFLKSLHTFIHNVTWYL